MRAAELSAVDYQGFRRIAEESEPVNMRRTQDPRTALLVDNESSLPVLKLYRALASRGGNQVRYEIFSDERKALAWLSGRD